MADLDYFIYDTADDPDILFCMLHGLGSNGHDFESLPDYLQFKGYKVRFLFPHAPRRPVTINQGFVMPAWYDIASLEIEQKKDYVGMAATLQSLESLLVKQYAADFRPERTILAGFSQGGAVALWKALQDQQNYLAVLCLSGYLFDQPDRFPAQARVQRSAIQEAERAEPEQQPTDTPAPSDSSNSPLPSRLTSPLSGDHHPPAEGTRPKIFFGHGVQDPVVPYALAKLSYQSVVDLGYQAVLKTYPIGHGVSLAEYQEIEAWCLEALQGFTL